MTRKVFDLTHEGLRKAAFVCLRRSHYDRTGRRQVVGFNCSLVVSEIVSSAYEVPDAIGWHYGSSILIEYKTSRADFFADADKPHRQGTGAGRRRYFLTPPSLVKVSELPEQWELLELHGREITKVHEPDWRERTLDTAAHIAENRILLSLLGRIKAREFLFIAREDMDRELCEAASPESEGGR